MMQKVPTASPHAIPGRFEALLRSTGDLLGAQLSLGLPGFDGRIIQSAPLVCVACSKTNPDMFRACPAHPSEGSHDRLNFPHLQQWICPNHCEVVTIPVKAPDGTFGMLHAVRPPAEEGSGARDDQEMLRFLGNLARLLTEHLTLRSELFNLDGALKHRSDELNLLQAISGRLTEKQDIRQAIRDILRRGRGTLEADAAVLSIETKRIFELAANPALQEPLRSGSRHWRHLGNVLSRHLKNNRRRYYSGPVSQLGVDGAFHGVQAHVLGAAVRTHEEIGGSLCLVFVGNERQKHSTDIRLLDSLAERVATTLANSELYENLKDFLMATVKSLVSAIDAKDRYTSGHSERVNILSMLLGKTMGLGKEELEVLRWASILHDVGKIGIPESILNKPGRLTPEEFEIIKEHPDRGYRVIAPIRQLSAASLAVRCHHEMVNGCGYPLGLRDEEIPLQARIIAVADTFDALTSSRPYRSPRTPDQAFAVITDVRGTQLDASVVEVLEELMPFIREHHVMLQATTEETTERSAEDRQAEAA